jgi:hypothetical protein
MYVEYISNLNKNNLLIDGSVQDIYFEDYLDVNIELHNLSKLLQNKKENKNKLHYWLYKPNERNILDSSLFNEYLWYLTLNKIIKIKKQKELIIFQTNSISLYRLLIKSEFTFISKINLLIFGFSSLINFLKFLIRPYIYITKSFFRSLILKSILKVEIDNTKQLIISWAPSITGDDHPYKDFYFNNFMSLINKNGGSCKTVIIPSGKRKLSDSILYSKKNNDIYPFEIFLSFFDFLRILIDHYRTVLLYFRNKVDLKDKDLMILISSSFIYESITEANLIYYVIKNLSNYNIKYLFLTFENDKFDKSVLLSKNMYKKSIITYGFFHTTKPRNLISLFPASFEESTFSPVPDVIYLNFDFYEKFLVKNYNVPCIPGVSFKLSKFENLPYKKLDKKILICLPGTIQNIKKILEFMLHNVDILVDFKIKIRPHPMLGIPKEFLKIILDNGYEISTCNLFEDLKHTTHVICSYSGVLFESALLGRNVGYVIDSGVINMNPFDDTGFDNYFFIKDASDLKLFVESEFKYNPIDIDINDQLIFELVRSVL